MFPFKLNSDSVKDGMEPYEYFDINLPAVSIPYHEFSAVTVELTYALCELKWDVPIDMDNFEAYISVDRGISFKKAPVGIATLQCTGITAFSAMAPNDTNFIYKAVSKNLLKQLGPDEIITNIKIRPYGKRTALVNSFKLADVRIVGYGKNEYYEPIRNLPFIKINVDEARKKAVSEMHRLAGFRWIPDKTINIVFTTIGLGTITYEKGVTYKGLPYVPDYSYSSVEAFTAMMKDGVYIGGGIDRKTLYGTQCSRAVHMSHSNVIRECDKNVQPLS